jgi:class 3 adenylate cyclase
MNRRFARWALLLSTLLASAICDAAFYYDREGQIAKFGPEISYRIENPAAPSTFESISRETSGWISQKEKPFAGTSQPASLWIRFEIPPGIEVRRALLNVPLFEHEEFFIVRDGRLVDRQKAGVMTPWDERAVRVTMLSTTMAGFVPVELVPNARTTVFGRLETQNRFVEADVLLARLWDHDRVLDAERADRLMQGLFFGLIFFLVAYNLGLFIVVREPSFLYYVIMEVGFAVTWAAINGLTFEYFAPHHPEWEFRTMWIGGLIGGIGLWQFVRHYLGLARTFPRIDRLLAVIGYTSLALVPLAFFPFAAAFFQRVFLVCTPIGVVVLIFITGLAVKRKIPAARSFLVAMACMGIGFVAFTAATSVSWFPSNYATLHAGQIGSALAGVILSIGLGFRLQDERTRLGRLKRFLSPKVSELIAAGALDDPLATRRREVTIVFVDLRGFTAFSETAEPEDVLRVLREYHAEVGRLVDKYQGTIEHFAGDGVMLIFNDPAPLPDPALAAVSMAVELRDNVERLAESWQKLGHKLACGLGIAQGFATIGTIGFPGRQDYGVIGAVNNHAARLCGQAAAGQVLVSQRVFARVEGKVVARSVGELALKGIAAPTPAYEILSMAAASEEATVPTLA